MDFNETHPLLSGLTLETGLATRPAPGEAYLPRFERIEDMIKTMRPYLPVRCFHPEAITKSAKEFLEGFPGKVFYAVKANPSPYVIRRLVEAGVCRFDVASINEMALVHSVAPGAHMAFMHTIKNRESIRKAYFVYGIRDFAVDCTEELYKILEETNTAQDLSIHVRLSMPQDMSSHPLSKKFGASADEAVVLLNDAAKVAHKVGLCFHVGHLCYDHKQYSRALAYAAGVIKQAEVEIDVLDVGGGFARSFPGHEASLLSDYFSTLREGIASLNLPETCQIWGEPGLALVADSESLVVRVELRKGDSLYINDGTYGSLFDAAKYADKKRFPVTLVRLGRKSSTVLHAFEFYGPTCDSVDHMPGPFMLPKDAREGDWIIIGRQGAYGGVFQTTFNGFYSTLEAEITGQQPLVNKKRNKKLSSSVVATSKSSEILEQ